MNEGTPMKSKRHSQDLRPRAERLAAGKALREKAPRERHGSWKKPTSTRDPVAVLEESSRGRLPELIPIRYGRMLSSPFAFLRGSAGLMANDLAEVHDTGLQVQACGDCHLMNFGLFATPERNLVFDINDFDETLPAPWEWDVKRLAASFVAAARENGHADKKARGAATTCVRAYREHLRECSKKSPMDLWYEHLDVRTLIEMAPGRTTRTRRKGWASEAHHRSGESFFPQISAKVEGRSRLVDHPPFLYHWDEATYAESLHDALTAYRASMIDSVRALLDRYRLADWAMKVVGIGSVGTRCFVALFLSAEGHPLLLQFKEERPSVLAPHAGQSVYRNQAQRVVMGQRLMQSASDVFLGWTRTGSGVDYVGRQLRDMKFSIPIERFPPRMMSRYAEVCGWALARAHARSGDAAVMSGYLGKSDAFDQAVGEFAMAYADQTARDHAALVAAVTAGRVKARLEGDR
jgi:uncharacterized protein (DUF2252 family)